MQDITKNIGSLLRRMKEVEKEFPGTQRALHEHLGDAVERLVRLNVHGYLNDARGKIAGWQQKYVGSKGGYVAVRATNSSTGDNSPGAITNYLENGHRRSRPSRYRKNYQPRIRHMYVNGRHFYQQTRLSAEPFVRVEAEKFAQDTARRLRG